MGVRLPFGHSRVNARCWFLALPQRTHLVMKRNSLSCTHPLQLAGDGSVAIASCTPANVIAGTPRVTLHPEEDQDGRVAAFGAGSDLSHCRNGSMPVNWTISHVDREVHAIASAELGADEIQNYLGSVIAEEAMP